MLNTKFILLLGSAFLLNTVVAQKITLGARAGIQSSAFRVTSTASDDKISIENARTGFLLGITADYKFSPNWSLQPHLLVTMRNGAIIVSEEKTRVIALDLPLNILHRNDNFFIGAGPNFSYGFSAKGIPYDDGEDTKDYYSPSGNGIKLKRFELGINALMGYEFPSGITVAANYTRGLTPILNVKDEAKVHSRMFGISIGYCFNKQ
jgi:hypothetical protein